MKIVIRLLKTWKNGETQWPEGQLLNIEESDAAKLFEQKIAEKYEPNPVTDVMVASPVKADTGFSKDQVLEIIKELNKSSETLINPKANDTQEEKYLATGGFKSMSHFAYEVYKSTSTKQLSETMSKWDVFNKNYEKASGMSEGVAADGGYLVPTEFRATLMRNTLEASLFLNRATKVPMATNSIEIPVIKETTHVGSVYGGIIVYRVGEAVAVTASKPAFGKVRLQLSKLAAACYVTNELLEDSPISMEPLLGSMFAEALAFQIDEDMLNGTGVAQMLGILNAPCLVSVTKETGQPAATIVTENIIKMWSRLLPMSQGNAIFIANTDCFPQLATLQLNVGTGGSTAGLLNVSTNGVTGRPIMSLLGAPLFLTEHAQTVGTAGEIGGNT